MKRFLQDEIVRDIVGSAVAHHELEAEFSQLEKDREVLRSIFPSGNNKVIHKCDALLNVKLSYIYSHINLMTSSSFKITLEHEAVVILVVGRASCKPRSFDLECSENISH